MDNAYKYEDLLLSWPVTIAGTIGYLVAVYLGKKLMESQTKFELKGLMTVHNVVLFVWSVAMCAGGLYETISAFRAHPFLDVYCASKSRPGSERIMTGKAWFWIWLFFASKFYEFLDTAFIVLRKSNLLFLHVYVRFCSTRSLARPHFAPSLPDLDSLSPSSPPTFVLAHNSRPMLVGRTCLGLHVDHHSSS